MGTVGVGGRLEQEQAGEGGQTPVALLYTVTLPPNQPSHWFQEAQEQPGGS